jgi:hypothetical protein
MSDRERVAAQRACKHRPVVRRFKGPGEHYLVCGECGLLLHFPSLEEAGVKTDDWRALPDITEAQRHRLLRWLEGHVGRLAEARDLSAFKGSDPRVKPRKGRK